MPARSRRPSRVSAISSTIGMRRSICSLSSSAGASSSDCLAQTSLGADTLVNPEPGFFILGSKAYGRNNTFLMRVGWQQVEEVFGLLAAEAA